MSLLDPLIASLRARLTKLERNQLTPREGIVTQNTPMMVRLDGDSVDTPVRQIAHASVGSRVLCMKLGFRYYMIGQVGGQGSILLDEVDMSGQDMPGGSGHTLHIPPALQGTFRSYTVEVTGGVSGGFSHGANAFMVRINGDSGENYRSSSQAWTSDGTIVSSLENDSSAFPRSGYISTYRALTTVTLKPMTLGDTGFFSWEASGWGNIGSGVGGYMFQAGGRWNGSVQRITQFNFRTSSISGRVWTSNSRAELWGHR